VKAYFSLGRLSRAGYLLEVIYQFLIGEPFLKIGLGKEKLFWLGDSSLESELSGSQK
jgi:hypothetical protein